MEMVLLHQSTSRRCVSDLHYYLFPKPSSLEVYGHLILVVKGDADGSHWNFLDDGLSDLLYPRNAIWRIDAPLEQFSCHWLNRRLRGNLSCSLWVGSIHGRDGHVLSSLGQEACNSLGSGLLLLRFIHRGDLLSTNLLPEY